MSVTTVDPVLESFRRRITAMDEQITQLVNERVAAVTALAAYKRARDIPARDEARERSLVKHLVEANQGPLSAEGVSQLARFLLQLTREEAGVE